MKDSSQPPIVSGDLIVRIGVESESAEALLSEIVGKGVGVIAEETGVRLQFALESVFDASATARLVADARRADRNYVPPAFDRAFFVRVQSGASKTGVPADVLARVVEFLERVKEVGSVEVRGELEGPSVLPLDEPAWLEQGYVHGKPWPATASEDDPKAPMGTNAWYLWRFPGGDGRGVQLADVEAGWDLTGPELSLLPWHVVRGAQLSTRDDPEKALKDNRHGALSLGVVCACDNSSEVVGVVPHVDSVKLANYRGGSDALGARIEDAIVAATNALSAGDVLLIETEIWGWEEGEDAEGQFVWVEKIKPVEANSTVFDAILAATTKGVIVIEPAGNGTLCIDELIHKFDDGTKKPLNKCDSGAIVVGAGSSHPDAAANGTGADLHRRSGKSNWGERVDCWSWGDAVATVFASGAAAPSVFEGTSSAAAIIAGLAVGLQGAFKMTASTATEPILTPDRMRELMRTPSVLAHKQFDDNDAQIGKQPDVQKIVDEHLRLPFPFVRDCEGDDGGLTHALERACPDVCIRAADSPASGPPFVDDPVAAGSKARVHVRAHNRGGHDARDVVLDVYGTAPTLAPAPWLMTHLATVTIDAIPAVASPGEPHGHADGSELIDSLPVDAGNMRLDIVLRHDPEDTRLASQAMLEPPHRAWMERVRSLATRNVVTVPFTPKHALRNRMWHRLPFLAPGPRAGAPVDAVVTVATEDWAEDAVWLELPAFIPVPATGDFDVVDQGEETYVICLCGSGELALPRFQIEATSVVEMAWLLDPTVAGEVGALGTLRAVMAGSEFADGVRWTVSTDGQPVDIDWSGSP